MKRPLKLHLKAALVCAIIGVVLALPLLWVPLLPFWKGWRPPVVSPRLEAVIAVFAALLVAWSVVDIPRKSLKILVWIASLWLLGSGIWLIDLYGYSLSSLVPMTAAVVAGAAGLVFSYLPAGSRRAHWESLVGNRVSADLLKTRIDESYLEEDPRHAVLCVVEVLWSGEDRNDKQTWEEMGLRATAAAEHFQDVGGYLERCDGEGACFVFGCWGQAVDMVEVLRAVNLWVSRAGGCASVVRGECVTGVGALPTGARWTITGLPLRQARRMAAAARSYAVRVLVEDDLAKELGEEWMTRRIVWWDFEGKRLLLCEVQGEAKNAGQGAKDNVRRWNYAWEAFWEGDWLLAEDGFTALAREADDGAARIFALRSQTARRQEA